MKKILSALIIAMAITPISAFAQFTDIADSKAKSEITALAERGIIEGTSDTEFSPDANVTRAEFAAMLARAFDVSVSEYNNQFTDVYASDWFAKEASAMAELGITDGYDDNTFRPYNNITNQEAQKLLVCTFESFAENIVAPLAYASFIHDSNDISGWATSYVGKAEIIGCLVYEQLEGKVLKMYPTKECTREDAALGIYRVLSAVDNYKTRVYAEEE